MLITLLMLVTLNAADDDAVKPFDPAVDARSDRKGRERALLAPTEVTLPARTASLGLDELVWPRFTLGLTDRLQFSAAAVALPFPFAGGAVLPIGGIVALGGAGVGVAGAFAVGVKYRLLDESAVLPGIAVGYELVDFFVAGAGVGAAAAVGNGAGAAVVPTVGLVNAQLNVFSLVAGKHFGALHLIAGGFVIDNHNILPQSASLAMAVFATGGGATTSGKSQRFDRLPTQLVPLVGAEYVLGPRASLAAEAFIRFPLTGSFGTTGARWVIRERGQARFRIDAAAVWVYLPPDRTDPASPRPGLLLPQPWVSMAVYFG